MREHFGDRRNAERFQQKQVVVKQKLPNHKRLGSFWSWEWDSNPRPTHYECVALPTELFQRKTNLPNKYIIVL